VRSLHALSYSAFSRIDFIPINRKETKNDESQTRDYIRPKVEEGKKTRASATAGNEGSRLKAQGSRLKAQGIV
jgi:hypothetical protein